MCARNRTCVIAVLMMPTRTPFAVLFLCYRAVILDIRATEVTVYDSTQMDALQWSTYVTPSSGSSSSRGWREASYTAPDGDIHRIYTVCNVMITADTDHWLLMPHLAADTANRIYIRVRFIMRRCADFADSSSRHHCKETFRLLYSTSDDEMSRDSRWNQSTYTDYDVIAGAHLFTSANNASVNDVTLGFPLTHAGATFAFRDRGACMTLMSVRVYYVTCDVITSGFASFPATPSGPEPTSLVSVDGQCVDRATITDGQPAPRGHCKADGSWLLVTGGCQCAPGYQPSHQIPNVCTGCPPETYKSAVGNGNCTTCPENSATDSWASVSCRCAEGLDRHIVNGQLVRCSDPHLSVRNLSVTYSNDTSVQLSWLEPMSSTSVEHVYTYRIECTRCSSTVTFRPGRRRLNSTAVSVHGLRESTRYTMSVFVESGAGRPVDSTGVSVVVTTRSAQGKDHRALVDGLHVTSYGSDFVSLGWTAPEGSTADLYQVRCRSDETGVNDVAAFTVEPNITVWSLQPGTTYSFAVKYRSNGVWSEYCDSIAVTTAQPAVHDNDDLESTLVGVVAGTAVAVVITTAVIVLVAVIVVLRSRRQRDRQRGSECGMLHYANGGTANSGTMSGSVHIYAEPDELIADGPAMSDNQHHQQHQLDPAHVVIDAVLERGSMSDVCHGRLVRPGRAPVAVSLSVLHELTSDVERRNFLTTAVKMATLSSDNVQRLEGIVSSRTPYMIVTQLSSNGSLLDFIRAKGRSLMLSQLVDMLCGVACGMQHIISKGFIHTDLAARNVVVDEKLVCEISAIDRCEHLNGSEPFARRRRIAVRWSAPEVLLGRPHTPASNVWSYGVLAWEVTSFGQIPYDLWDDDEVAAAVTSGAVLSRPPESCPISVYQLMVRCWAADADQRVTFPCIVQSLNDHHQQLLINSTFTDNSGSRQIVGQEEHTQMNNASVSQWLHSLQLDEYIESFHSAGYTTVHDLMDVNAADLERIGVTSASHQRLLLYALDRIRETINSASVV